jgi:hypothetical protein
MVLLIDPDGALLERADVLPEDLELDGGGADAPGLGGDDDVAASLPRRRQRHNLARRLPFRDEQTVRPVDEHTGQVLQIIKYNGIKANSQQIVHLSDKNSNFQCSISVNIFTDLHPKF